MTAFFDMGRRLAGKPALLLIFILCALPVGVLSALITPPGQSPDEPSHLARAAGLLHGAILAVRQPGTDPNDNRPELQTGVRVDIGLLIASTPAMLMVGDRPVVTTQTYIAARQQPANHTGVFVNLPGTATYFPAAYVPAALGMALGLGAGASPFVCFVLARLFMLAAFLLLGGATLWIAAYGEALLLTVLLLPMTLFLAGSVNQDGMLVAMSCLACAALTRGYRWAGLVLLALVLASKPPYFPLLGVFLLPLLSPGVARRLREVAIAAAPVLVWIALAAAFVIVPWFKPPYHPGPLYTGAVTFMDHANAGDALHILLARPSRFITLPLLTLRDFGANELRAMIGVLGGLQIVLPDMYYRLWGASILAALLGVVFVQRPMGLTPRVIVVNALFAAALIIGTVWLIMITLYLDWTDVGMNFIDGIEGRYFLPLLPFLVFALPAWRLNAQLEPLMTPQMAMLIPAIPAVLMGLFDIGYIPVTLMHFFYLRP